MVEKLKWETVAEETQFKMNMNYTDEARAWEIGKLMAEAVLKEVK